MADVIAKTQFVNTDKFKGVILAIEKQLIGQANLLTSIDRTLRDSHETAKEALEDSRREQIVDELKPDLPPTPENEPAETPTILDRIKKMFSGLDLSDRFSLRNIITTGMLAMAAPVIFEFAKGFFEQFAEKVRDGSVWSAVTNVLGSDLGVMAASSMVFGLRNTLIGQMIGRGIMSALHTVLDPDGNGSIFGVDLSFLDGPVETWVGLMVTTLLSMVSARMIGKTIFKGLGMAATGLFASGKAVANTMKPTAASAGSTAAKTGAVAATETAVEVGEAAAKQTATKIAAVATTETAAVAGEKVVERGLGPAALKTGGKTLVKAFPLIGDFIVGATMAEGDPMRGVAAAIGSFIGRLGGAAAGAIGGPVGIFGGEVAGSIAGAHIAAEMYDHDITPEERQKAEADWAASNEFAGVSTDYQPIEIMQAKPQVSSGLVLSDTNAVISKLMQQYAAPAGPSNYLSGAELATKLNRAIEAAQGDASKGYGSNVIIGGTTSNTRGGDVYNNSSTVIYNGSTPADVLGGSSVPANAQ